MNSGAVGKIQRVCATSKVNGLDNGRNGLLSTGGSQGILPLSFLALILTALLLMTRIEWAFNLIWRVPTARSMRNRVVMYWAVLILGSLALSAAIALSAQPVLSRWS